MPKLLDPLHVNKSLSCDVARIIENSRRGKIREKSKTCETNTAHTVPTGEKWQANFWDIRLFKNLRDHISPGWWVVIRHGRRTRCCEIVDVGVRRLRVRRLSIDGESGQGFFIVSQIKPNKIHYIIKTDVK